MAASVTRNEPCNSGSVTITQSFPHEGKASSGDSSDISYDKCRYEPGFGDYLLFDGRISYRYNKVTGDLWGGNGTMIFTAEYDQFVHEIGGSDPFSSLTDGAMAYELESNPGFSLYKMRWDKVLGRIKDGEGSTTFVSQNGMDETQLNKADGTSLSKGKQEMSGKSTEGSHSLAFSVEVEHELHSTGDMMGFSSGTIVIRDKNSAAIVTLRVLSETMLQVEYDQDGDGVAERTSTSQNEGY